MKKDSSLAERLFSGITSGVCCVCVNGEQATKIYAMFVYRQEDTLRFACQSCLRTDLPVNAPPYRVGNPVRVQTFGMNGLKQLARDCTLWDGKEWVARIGSGDVVTNCRHGGGIIIKPCPPSFARELMSSHYSFCDDCERELADKGITDASVSFDCQRCQQTGAESPDLLTDYCAN